MDSIPLLSLDHHVLCNVLEKMPFNNLISLRKTCHFADEFVRENRKRLYKRTPRGYCLKMVIAEKPKEKKTLLWSFRNLFQKKSKEEKIRIYFVIDNMNNMELLTVVEGDLRIIDLPFEYFTVVSRVSRSLSSKEETLVIDCLRRLELSAPYTYIENLLQTTTLRIMNEVNCQKEITLKCVDYQNQLEMERKITRGPSKIVFNVTKEVKPNDNEIFHSLINYSHVEIDSFCPSFLTYFLNGLYEADDLGNFQTALFVKGGREELEKEYPLSIIWDSLEQEENVPFRILRMRLRLLHKWVFLIQELVAKDCNGSISCRIVVTNCDMDEQMALLSSYFMDSKCFGSKFRMFLRLPDELRKTMRFLHNC